jgi:photosystem II stability/assembly factor-like uncharacterized protein
MLEHEEPEMRIASVCSKSVLLLLALLVSTTPLLAVNGQWRSLGPDGGSVYSLAFQPGSRQVMYAGVEGGVYKSVNRGTTWTWAGEGLDVFSRVDSLAVDPVRTSTVYASSGGRVFKSLNGGQTWQVTGLAGPFAHQIAVQPNASGKLFAATNQGLYRSSDGGATWSRLTRGLPEPSGVRLILFDPASPKRLYAFTVKGPSLAGRLFKSTDTGASWRPADGGLENQSVLALAIDPRSPQTLYAGTGNRVYKSVNGGATWKKSGLIGLTTALMVHPTQGNVVYAGTVAGLFRSTDGGSRWARLSQGLPGQGTITALAVFPSSSQSLYAGVSTTVERGGVFNSTDGGESWALHSRGLSALAVSSVAIDSQTAGTLWIVANTLLFKSTDQGATWTRVQIGQVFGDHAPSKVVVDPFDSATVYVLLGGGELRRTRDGGQTWEVVGDPQVSATKILLDPQTPSTLYATWMGIAKSTDGGTTWTRLSGAVADLYVSDLVISPSSPFTLYLTGGATGGQQQILRTMDGGATWTQVPLDIPPAGPSAAVSSLDVDSLMSTTVLAARDGEVYRTLDGGATWSLFSNVFQTHPLYPLATSTAPSGRFYAAVWDSGVYEGSDTATVWSPLGSTPLRASFWALAVDPLDACRIYAATLNRGLFVFTKEGPRGCP